jgi:tetratricopeptide (TPR) repeat protein
MAVRLGGALLVPVLLLAQSPASPTARLRPVVPGLDPVPLSDLARFEDTVQDQLGDAARSFQSLADRQPAVSTPELAAAYGGLGQLYHAYALTEAAAFCYENASRLAPGDHRWHHLLGRLREGGGALEQAAVAYRSAREARPDYAASAIRLGIVRLEQGRLAEARDALDGALTLVSDPAARAALGEVALAAREYTEAVSLLQSALAQAPEATRLHYLLGMAHRGLGDLAQARAHLALRGTAGVRPDDPLVDGLQTLVRGERVNLLRGHLAYAAGQFQEAVSAFAAAPDSAAGHVNLGVSLLRLGSEQEAVDELDRALDLDPGNLTAHFNLGMLRSAAGDPTGAIPHLEAVVAGGADPAAARALAEAYLAGGRSRDAETRLAALVGDQPDDEEALMMLVGIYAQTERFGLALARLDEAFARVPGRERTANALGRLLAAAPDASLRDGRRALEIGQRLYESTPVVAHGETVALALAELGRCGEAADWQRRLIEAAERAGSEDIVAALVPALDRYARGAPCRPPGAPPR